MSVSVDPVLLRPRAAEAEHSNFVCSFSKEDLNIQTMALNRDQSLVVVGGRKEFRVLQLTKEVNTANKNLFEYSQINELTKYSTRKRTSLDYGIQDVQWNPSKSFIFII